LTEPEIDEHTDVVRQYRRVCTHIQFLSIWNLLATLCRQTWRTLPCRTGVSRLARQGMRAAIQPWAKGPQNNFRIETPVKYSIIHFSALNQPRSI